MIASLSLGSRNKDGSPVELASNSNNTDQTDMNGSCPIMHGKLNYICHRRKRRKKCSNTFWWLVWCSKCNGWQDFFRSTYCINGCLFPHPKNSSTKVDQDAYKLYLLFDQISTVMWRNRKYGLVWPRSNPVKIEKKQPISCQYKKYVLNYLFNMWWKYSFIQFPWKLRAIIYRHGRKILWDRLYSSSVLSLSVHNFVK